MLVLTELRVVKTLLYGLMAGVLVTNFLLWLERIDVYNFFIQYAEAAYDTFLPEADGTVSATQTTCGTSVPNSECLDENTATSSSPDTTGDYLTFNDADSDYYVMENATTTSIDTVDDIWVPVYHQEGSNMALYVSLWDQTELTQYGTEVQLVNTPTSDWETAEFLNLGLTASEFDNLRVRLRCARPGGGQKNDCTAYAMYLTASFSEVIDVTVSSAGTQQDLEIGTTTAHVGGTFVVTENTGSRNVTDITITASSTVDAQSHLDNIELYYDLDTSDPYTCDDQSFNPTDSQFGTTDSDGFSATNTATFSDTVGISTTQTLCVYPVLDVTSDATFNEKLDILIADPSTQVKVGGGGKVDPASAVDITDTTNLLAADLRQTHYHWRNDDGDEANASSATNGNEDVVIDTASVATTYRLRVEVSNEGNLISDSTQFRLEYATNTSSCGSATGWQQVNGTGDWDMSDSPHLTSPPGNTTNILEADGGVSDSNSVFVGTDGFEDSISQLNALTLNTDEFYEMEFAIAAAAGVNDGTSYCFRVTDAGTPLAGADYLVYPKLTIAADVTVSTAGAQLPNISIPSTTAKIGNFVITDNSGAPQSVEQITIAASGTVDYENHLDDIHLRYDLDTSDPYTCDDQSYDATDAQFGTTDTDGFSATGTATFNEVAGVTASTTQTICIYAVLGVTSGASDGEVFDIKINNPSTDVIVDTGSAAPAAVLDIPSFTTLTAPVVRQTHYHWRNDDGDQAGATSATGGSEDLPLSELAKNSTIRLRFGVANAGGEAASPHQFRLEWANKISSCAAATGWTDVDTASDEFTMADSQLVNDGTTTDIPIAAGGVSNDGYAYLETAGGQKESSSQTNNLTLGSEEVMDLEYSIQATDVTNEGASYCFRVTDAGTAFASDNYLVYPEVTIKLATDFVVTRGVATIGSGSTTAHISEGVDYTLRQNDATRAFVRITNVAMTGAGFANTGNNDAADVTAYIDSAVAITSGVTFTRFGNTDSTRVAWEVVEYVGAAGGDNEIVVREASTLTYGSTNLAATTSVISGVVDNNAVVPFITGQGNPDTGRFDYNTGLSTSAWNAGATTTTFTRGEAGSDAVVVSYAVVEFTGINWKIQRAPEHTYSNVGALESESITAVNSENRTFLHVQKRVGAGLDTHANFGQTVYLDGIGTIQYRLSANASTPGDHTAVVWVIENTQTSGAEMRVWRSNGSIPSSGTAPVVNNPAIGTTLDDLTIASIFTNARADGSGRSYQEPIISARLLNSSTTEYELWVGDPSDNITYQTEVVEWPTAEPDIYQNYFLFYVDNDALTPIDIWPAGASDLSENAEMTATDDPIASGEAVRIRMTLNIDAATLPAGTRAFNLEYAERPELSTCSALGEASWRAIGDSSSTTALWRGNAATPTDGDTLPSVLISVSDKVGSYEEANPTALVPSVTTVGEDIEYDWNLEDNGAADKTDYCFRMVNSDGSLLTGYNNYPVVRTVGYEPEVGDWRWYGDETSFTPSSDLAGTNTAPTGIADNNIIKLRTVVAEKSGASGVDVKFKVQYSQYSDFSQAVFDVVSTSTCTENSIWCYADGAGIDNDPIDAAVIATADPCSSGTGDGCGTHNEGTATSSATLDHPALANTEFEFTIANAGARANAVYYFRLYNINEDTVVAASSSYPSVQVAGPQLTFTIEGLPAGTTTEGVTTDIATTPTQLDFGSIPFSTEYTGAQRLKVDTSATEGYQVLMFVRQELINTYGEIIAGITGTNDSPVAWNTGCSSEQAGCFGYHAGDDTLSGGSARFSPPDSYAAFATTSEEVMFSSVPGLESDNIVYKIEVTEGQTAGDYETSIVYVAIPTF